VISGEVGGAGEAVEQAGSVAGGNIAKSKRQRERTTRAGTNKSRGLLFTTYHQMSEEPGEALV
jgi:hypothetical protein